MAYSAEDQYGGIDQGYEKSNKMLSNMLATRQRAFERAEAERKQKEAAAARNIGPGAAGAAGMAALLGATNPWVLGGAALAGSIPGMAEAWRQEKGGLGSKLGAVAKNLFSPIASSDNFAATLQSGLPAAAMIGGNLKAEADKAALAKGSTGAASWTRGQGGGANWEDPNSPDFLGYGEGYGPQRKSPFNSWAPEDPSMGYGGR